MKFSIRFQLAELSLSEREHASKQDFTDEVCLDIPKGTDSENAGGRKSSGPD